MLSMIAGNGSHMLSIVARNWGHICYPCLQETEFKRQPWWQETGVQV